MGYPRLSDEERRSVRRLAERDGWRPAEWCECKEPRPIPFTSVTTEEGHYYISGLCERCRRKVRREA